MRPVTAPSGIFASSTRGAGSSARLAAGNSRPTRAANIVTPFIAASWRSVLLSTERWRAGGLLLDIHLVEGGTQARGELARIVIGPEMQEEHARLFVEHVAVQGGDLDAVGLQGLDHRVDLRTEQDEVTGDGCRVETRGLEVDGNRRAHRARQRHTLIGYGLRARNAELIDAAAILPPVSHD